MTAALAEAVRELIADTAIELDDDRLSYLTAQIGRESWRELAAALAAYDSRAVGEGEMVLRDHAGVIDADDFYLGTTVAYHCRAGADALAREQARTVEMERAGYEAWRDGCLRRHKPFGPWEAWLAARGVK
jgi:hypothetical protein